MNATIRRALAGVGLASAGQVQRLAEESRQMSDKVKNLEDRVAKPSGRCRDLETTARGDRGETPVSGRMSQPRPRPMPSACERAPSTQRRAPANGKRALKH